MKVKTRKLRSPAKWHGGKSYLAARIIGKFPPHETYVEPFIGGGSILLNKFPARREVAGDANPELINLWRYLQDPFGAVAALAGELRYDEATFETARQWLTSDNLGCRAVGFLVRNRFSRGGQPGDVNAWETIKAELPAIAQRIQRVEFGVCDASQLIRRLDAADTLFYLDPPYLHETRTAKKAYAFEMDRGDHEALLTLVQTLRGKVFLSGYRSALYDEALADWTRHEFDMPNHSGQGATKQRRIECLWESPSTGARA